VLNLNKFYLPAVSKGKRKDCFKKSRHVVVIIPASYLGGPGFKSRAKDLLSWQIFRGFSQVPRAVTLIVVCLKLSNDPDLYFPIVHHSFVFMRSRVQISTRRPAILSFFIVFLSPFKQMLWYYFKLGRDRLLPHPFQFIIHVSPLRSTLRSPSHWKGVTK
jgi:hypothetical protein